MSENTSNVQRMSDKLMVSYKIIKLWVITTSNTDQYVRISIKLLSIHHDRTFRTLELCVLECGHSITVPIIISTPSLVDPMFK